MAKKSTEEKVLEALEMTDKSLIKLSTGVVLRGKPAPAQALIKVMGAFPRPKPPTYFNDKMGRDLENPDDPDYQERVKANQLESAAAMLNVLILYGTQLESIPKGLSKPESDDWLEAYKLLGMPLLGDNKAWRYLTWVMFVAAPTAEDTAEIQKVVGRLSGVSDEAVKSADEFPGSE